MNYKNNGAYHLCYLTYIYIYWRQYRTTDRRIKLQEKLMSIVKQLMNYEIDMYWHRIESFPSLSEVLL